jgi:ATP-dependent helicase/nuclease subunit A
MSDQIARQIALDPGRSFIVQAPAGSGKTELLIQRFLSLLSVVEKSPEEILAITFTKKAAAEMRERICQALELATQPEPTETYKHQTWLLAKKAMARSEELNWDLLNKTARLRIQTIDSFCASLVQQMPLLSRLGTISNTCQGVEANALYEEAANRLLYNVSNKDAIQKLLLHFDNKIEQVVELIVSMLSKRDQWLPLLAQLRGQGNLRANLEGNLNNLVNQILQQASDYFPAHLKSEAVDLLAYSSTLRRHHREGGEPGELEKNWIPPSAGMTLEAWKALANLLLTQSHEWRKTITVKDGFPSKADGKTIDEKNFFQTQKDKHKALIEALNPLDDLKEALAAASQAPHPQYPDRQWVLLETLLNLLPLAVAELKVLFQNTNQVDFIEVTQAAILALGNQENPSDLALHLDYQLRHILVDEFQDTSASQFRLLSLLTEQWQNDGSRTLFLVGDPMQSIYRFRGAEVGLFLSAKQNGISQIPLEFLQLQNNFRSQKKIIDWINAIFPSIFPQHEDLAHSKIKFTPSIAIREPLNFEVKIDTTFVMPARSPRRGNAGIQEKPLESELKTPEHQQAEELGTQVLNIIQSQPTENTIAILVRSRNHLLEIIPTLQANKINYQAVEIEKLYQNMLIQDLVSLSCALLHLGDKLAWLSLLRSPYVGLSLDDLYLLSEAADGKTIWQVIDSDESIENFSIEGKKQLQKFRTVMAISLANRQRFGFRNEVEQTWINLESIAYFQSDLDTENAATFFNLLSTLEDRSQLINRELLTKHLEKLYAAVPVSQSSNKIQVMTVHKAKGLEFDTVILPCLEKTPQHDQDQLFLWFEQPHNTTDVIPAQSPRRGKAGIHTQQTFDLLIAPIKPKHHEADLIYQYLKQQQTRIQDYENSRLLYVAVTRARKQLYLLGKLAKDKDGNVKPAPEKSWLGKLLPK